MTADRQDLEQLRDQALRDLVDLDRQVTAGELPADVAGDLRARYEHAAATALARLAEDPEASAPATDRPPRRGRWAVYALALAVAAFATVVLLPTYVGNGSPGAR